MLCDALLAAIDTLAPSYLPFWQEICSIESPSDYKAGVDAVGRCFLAFAEKKNWETEVRRFENVGDCLAITMNPEIPAAPVVFSGHMDTVHKIGSLAKNPVRIEGDRLYGPGTVDCKGGLTAALLAMDALGQVGFDQRPVMLLLQSDEEVGSRLSHGETVRYLCEKSKNAIAFLNTECMRGDVLTIRRKGILRATLTVKGVAAHGASPWNGRNAILEAVYKLLAFDTDTWKQKDGLTCNCGLISGGTAVNAVADSCSVSLDIRFVSDEQLTFAKREIERIARDVHIPGTVTTADFITGRPPMEKTPQNKALFENVRRIFEEEGLGMLREEPALGGSDAAYTSGAGIPSMDSFGVDGGGIHAPTEYARLSSLPQAAKRLAAAAFRL